MIEHHHNMVYGKSKDYPKTVYNRQGKSHVIAHEGDPIPKGYGDYFDMHDAETGQPKGGEITEVEKATRAGAKPVDAKPGDNDLDADGHVWDAKLHAATRTKTSKGLWRMNVGVTRPEPMPGFPRSAEDLAKIEEARLANLDL